MQQEQKYLVQSPEHASSSQVRGAIPVADRNGLGPGNDGNSRALVGGDRDMPRSAQDVVQTEGEAVRTPQQKAAPASVSMWLFRPAEEARTFEFPELQQIVAEDANLAWIDLSEYSEQELRAVAELLCIPEPGIRTALASWQRPMLDTADDMFWVAVTVAHADGDRRRVQASQLDLFVGRNFLLSAHKVPLPFVDRILSRARRSPELVRLDSVFMLYIVLDELIHYYEGLGEHIDDEIEQMEERALQDTSDAILGDLLQLKRYIFSLSRLADQHRMVFTAFLRADFPFVDSERARPYYQDLQDRLTDLRGTLGAQKEVINGAFNIYVSHVSHRTSSVMKVLTVVSTVILPATLILSFFGTSFEDPTIFNPTSFWVMVGSIVVVTTAILYAFRRRGWI
jgi:magnesium transporter